MRINKNFNILNIKQTNFNSKVFGALYEIDMIKYGLRLDAHYQSSEELLHGSTQLANQIRLHTLATPISFESVYEFSTHRYVKHKPVKCLYYSINPSAIVAKTWLNDLEHKVCRSGSDNNTLQKLLKCTQVQRETTHG